MVGLISLFLLLYVGCESGYGAYVFTYGIKQAHMETHHAAYLNSAFWASFAVGRLLGIPVSLRFSSTVMIFSDLLGCILSLLCIIIFHDSAAILWIGSVAYGLSVASIYPSAINYAEAHVEGGVTGKVLSILVVSASLGDAIIPILMGLSFSTATGPLGMMLLTLGVAVGAALIFAIIIGCLAPRTKREAKEEEGRKRRRRMKRKAMKKKAAAQQMQKEQLNHQHSSNGSIDAGSNGVHSQSLPGHSLEDELPSASSSSRAPSQTSSASKPSNRRAYSAVQQPLHDEEEEDGLDDADEEEFVPVDLEAELEKEIRRPASPSESNHSQQATSPIRVQRVAGEAVEVQGVPEL
jgi:hypothetical protein